MVDLYTTLPGKRMKYVDELPNAIVLDLSLAKIIDLMR